MNAIDFLKRQIQSGIFPHAHLFYGTDKDAKEKAVEFLKAKFLGKYSADFLEIIPQEGSISIEQARFLRNAASRTSFSGKNVFLIRGLEYLTREAEVALLKTLEDSSQNNLFIATTENFNLLNSTIKSRFCVLRFFDEMTQAVRQLADGSKEDDLEIVVRNSMLKWMAELRKNFSPNLIYKLEKVLHLNQLLPISALNRRMVKEYIEMLDSYN